MSYQVLARKWRPAKFEQVVGQSHVLHALTNALTQQRLHHAYLFSGTRGVGKTSLARLFAKGLNCEQGVSADPCGECGSCVEIAQGRFVDLIEVDAASRTKVDDTRELLDNVQYRPSRGRYKVYLIDEVHMLSRSSFNALLKTLEEPPEHVKFLLATTDPQKLPITVLSRCLQFNLKSIAHEDIVSQLTHILTQESLAFEAQALTLIAKSANGSMRDALSLTDQAIAFGAGQIMLSQVQTMLGSIDEHHVISLLRALSGGDIARVMQVTHEVLSFGADADEVLRGLLELLHQITLTQFAPAAAQLSLNSDDILTFSKAMNAEQVQLYYQVLLTGRKDLIHAPDPKSGLEMALLRAVTFVPDSPIKRWEDSQSGDNTHQPSALARSVDTRVASLKSNTKTIRDIEPTSSREGVEQTGLISSEEATVTAVGLNDTQSSNVVIESKEAYSIPESAVQENPLKESTVQKSPVKEDVEAMPADLHAEMALIMSQAQSQGAELDLIPIEAIQEPIQAFNSEAMQMFVPESVITESMQDTRAFDDVESKQADLQAEVSHIMNEQEAALTSFSSSSMLANDNASSNKSLGSLSNEGIIGDDILDAVLAARESLLAPSDEEKVAKETGKKPSLAREKPVLTEPVLAGCERSKVQEKASLPSNASLIEETLPEAALLAADKAKNVEIRHAASKAPRVQDLSTASPLQSSEEDRPPWESPVVDESVPSIDSVIGMGERRQFAVSEAVQAIESPMAVDVSSDDVSSDGETILCAANAQGQAIAIDAPHHQTPLSGDRRDLLWYKFMAQLDVGGRVRQLAVNSVCHQFSQLIHLQLKPDQKHLCADVAITQLEEAMTKVIGQSVQLSVEIGIASQRETPLEVRKRFHQELLNDAQQDLLHDENIQWLMANMQAQLQSDTLTYAPPLLTEKSNDIELLTLDNFDKLSVAS